MHLPRLAQLPGEFGSIPVIEYHCLILHSKYRREAEATTARLLLTELTTLDFFGRGRT